MFGHTSLIFHI